MRLHRRVPVLTWRVSLDRRTALAAWAVAVSGLLVAVGVSGAPAVSVHDPVAFGELVELLDASERGAWLVEYRFERRRHDGTTLAVETVEARRRRVHVVRAPAAVTVELGDRVFECSALGPDGGRAGCVVRRGEPVLATADVLRALVGDGTYAVQTLTGEWIAGERARCFRVMATRGFVPEVGLVRELCFTGDAVPLRTMVLDVNGRDERVARRVVRDPGARVLAQLFADLDLPATGRGRP